MESGIKNPSEAAMECLKTLRNAIIAGEEIRIKGLFSGKVVNCSARVGTVPSRKGGIRERVEIPARKQYKIQVSNMIKTVK